MQKNIVRKQEDISQYEKYITHKGIECLNACLYNYISAKGFNELCHSDIFFIGKGLKIIYTGHPEERMIYSSQYESNIKFIKKFLPESKMDSVADCQLNGMKEFLTSQLWNNKNVIIQISSSRLPYNTVFQKKDNISHFINVIDYDGAEGKFYISDGCPPVTTEEIYEGWIEEEELLDNWESMGGKYLILDFENSKIFNETAGISYIKEMSEREFKKQVNSYIKAKRGVIRNEFKGCESINTLLKDMVSLFEKKVPDTKKIVMNVHRQIKLNGFLQAKEFILDKAIDMGKDRIICKEYEEIIRDWNKEMLLLVRAGIKIDIVEYRQIMEDIEVLTKRECEVLRELK
jgi:hypothetical protein